MDMTSVDKLMEPLHEADLAQARLDLPSWLLEDDGAQLGFCHGAKEMHSFSPRVVGHASPPFITADNCDLDIYDQIDWNTITPFSPQIYFPEDYKNQLKNFPLAEDETNQLSLGCKTRQSMSTTPVLTESTCELGSEEQSSPDVFLHWSGGIPSFVPSKKSLSHERDLGVYPQVISVPISDAITERSSIFKTEVAAPQIKSETPPMVIIRSVPSTVFSQMKEPQKVVINLKRISVLSNSTSDNASKTFGDVAKAKQPCAPTLKDVLSCNDADEQLYDLFKPVPLEQPISQRVSLVDEESCSVEAVEEIEPMYYEQVSTISPVPEPVETEMTYEELTEDSGIFLMSPASCNSEYMVSSPCITSSLNPVKSCGRKSRVSPYSPTEKKQRKKEQNKRAALRYRQKKKDEEDTILTKLQTEEERQKDLKEKYDSLQMEVRLMKNLMRDVFARRKFNN